MSIAKKSYIRQNRSFHDKARPIHLKNDLYNLIDSFIENGLVQVRRDGEYAAF